MKDDISKKYHPAKAGWANIGAYSAELMGICNFFCKPQIFDHMLIN
jgi:hypothetical protein